MDPSQLSHFRRKLLALRRDVLKEAQKILENFQQETQAFDPINAASHEVSWLTECSLLSHEQHLLNEIDTALERIDEGTYGYCEETGEPISLERLETYPMARLNREP